MKTYAQGIFRALWESLTYSREKNITTIAGSLAYTTVLSIIPLLAVAFFASKALGYLDLGFQKIQPFLFQNLAPGASQTVITYLQTFLNNSTNAKTFGAFGLVALFATSIFTFSQFVSSVTEIMHAGDEKSFIDRIFKSFLFILFAPALIGLSIALTTALPFHKVYLTFLIDFLVFFVSYGFFSKSRIPVQILLTTSCAISIIWEITKWGYKFYTSKALTYSKFYGSFSAIPLFLLWIYVGWLIILYGAALTYTLNKALTEKRNQQKQLKDVT